MTFRAEEKHAGVRLSSFLKGTCRVSSALLPRLKREGRILVNGTPTHVNDTLHPGDVVTVVTEEPETAPANLPPSAAVLYDDGSVQVYDKPAGMPTHPARYHMQDSLGTLVAAGGRPFRPVSRLDADTTGVLLAAGNAYAAAALSRAMREGKIRKEYLAVTCGVPVPGEGEIRLFTRPDPAAKSRRTVCAPGDDGARENVTGYRVLGTGTLPDGAPAALVLCRPYTGRTHQIRVSLAHRGCPIVGDAAYGAPSPFIARQALHARRVTFPHPERGCGVSVFSPLPEDFSRLLSLAGITPPEENE